MKRQQAKPGDLHLLPSLGQNGHASNTKRYV
jgi:hypothetical protein